MSENITTIDSYEPNYNCSCENCGQSPCVTAVKDGEVVAAFNMCGPCTFGTARALDPEWWNSDEE